MAVQSRDYLKSRFEHLDTPSAQDFADLIDTMALVGDEFVVDEDTLTLVIDEDTMQPVTLT